MPPILISANVGLARSTFANYREARFSFHSETLEPLINRVLRFFNHCLQYEFPDQGEIMADLTEMRSFLDDSDSLSSRASSLFAAGIITLNEARQMIGQDAVDEGDIRRIPMNIVEASEGQQAIEAPPETPALPEPVEQSNVMEIMKAPRVAPRAAKLRARLLRNREEQTDEMEKSIARYFRALKSRIDGTLGRYMERTAPDTTKEFPFTFSDLVPQKMEGELAEILFKNFTRVTRDTFGYINDSGVAGVLEWSERLPEVVSITSQADARAKIIHNTTKKGVQRMVETALKRGYSIETLARGMPADKFPGLKSFANESVNRARLIARTEVMRTQNLSSLGHFKGQGFEYVRADDVDGDADDTYVPDGDPYGRTCIERHGQIYSVEDAANIMDHPNGTLNWEPMPRTYKPEGVTV